LSRTLKPRTTGLIVFTSRIISIFTGLLFLIMVTRSLTPTSFGLWEFLLDVVTFATLPAGLFTYWATREVARGAVIGRTTQALCVAMSGAGLVAYAGLSLGTHSEVGSNIAPFTTAVILVPIFYWSLATQALVLGHNPAIGAYSLMISEPAKLLVAFPLLYTFKLGITGVILSIAVSYVVQSTCSTIQLRDVRKDRIDLAKAREWLKDYHVPALYTLTGILAIADTFVASLGARGTTFAGYYQAAFQVATIVSYSTTLSIALYPLLLKERSERLPARLLEFSLLFGIPMGAGTVALAPKILYLLKPAYVSSSSPALVFLSLAAVVTLVSTVFDQTLLGRDTADLNKEDRTRRMMASDQMFVSGINTAYFAAYLSVVFILARLSASSPAQEYQLVTYWGVAQLLLSCVLVGVKLRRVLKRTPLKLSASPALYVISAVVMGAVLLVVGNSVLPTGIGTLVFGLRMVGMVALGSAVYFSLLFGIDRRFRRLLRAGVAGVTGRGAQATAAPETGAADA
jgi:O-antigen/teichoic acid export membrane protein